VCRKAEKKTVTKEGMQERRKCNKESRTAGIKAGIKKERKEGRKEEKNEEKK
jgi:hypothetical protein